MVDEYSGLTPMQRTMVQSASTRAAHSDTTGIIDSDPHFVINPVTKEIKNSGNKITLAIGEHHSQRISFDCPRYIEGHDMMNCNKITVNYGTDGLYEVQDLKEKPNETSLVTFSWLITSNVTKVLGNVPFSIIFDCVQADGTITYSFATAINNSDILVINTLRHSKKVAQENVDILQQWKEQLFNGGAVVQQTSIFEGKTAVFFGDSLTEMNYHYKKGYHKWCQELLGLTSYKNYGQSSNKIADCVNKVSSCADNPDLVFVMIGVNDQTFHTPLGTVADKTVGTIYGGYDVLCKTLKEKFPTKLVVLITPHYQTKYPHNAGTTSYEVSKAMKEIAEKYALPVYDNYTLSGIYPTNLNYWTTDNCHWNDKAHEMVGKNLSKYMIDTFRYLADGTKPVEPQPPTPTKTLERISAVYSGGDVPVGTTLTALTGLVITAHYSDGSSNSVTGYQLSGSIVKGANTITVTYQSKTTTFVVNGIEQSTGSDLYTIKKVEVNYKKPSLGNSSFIAFLTKVNKKDVACEYKLEGDFGDSESAILCNNPLNNPWRYKTVDDFKNSTLIMTGEKSVYEEQSLHFCMTNTTCRANAEYIALVLEIKTSIYPCTLNLSNVKFFQDGVQTEIVEVGTFKVNPDNAYADIIVTR